jgi:magnesium-protoporphyrin O-methyltransferase
MMPSEVLGVGYAPQASPGKEVIPMACCAGYCAAETQFDGKRAEQDLRRYRRRGADLTTRLLLEELQRQPLEGRRLLDVGGGIGVISAELADMGVASVTMVEASPAFLEVARREVGSRYGSRPTQFILGDFAAVADTVPKADVVTLDRVVCCYPDSEALLRKAAERTLRLFAFTYSRYRWHVRMMIALENFWRRLTGNKFRAFVHLPPRMEAVLEVAGLVRAMRRETLVWVVELYCREEV